MPVLYLREHRNKVLVAVERQAYYFSSHKSVFLPIEDFQFQGKQIKVTSLKRTNRNSFAGEHLSEEFAAFLREYELHTQLDLSFFRYFSNLEQLYVSLQIGQGWKEELYNKLMCFFKNSPILYDRLDEELSAINQSLSTSNSASISRHRHEVIAWLNQHTDLEHKSPLPQQSKPRQPSDSARSTVTHHHYHYHYDHYWHDDSRHKQSEDLKLHCIIL